MTSSRRPIWITCNLAFYFVPSTTLRLCVRCAIGTFDPTIAVTIANNFALTLHSCPSNIRRVSLVMGTVVSRAVISPGAMLRVGLAIVFLNRNSDDPATNSFRSEIDTGESLGVCRGYGCNGTG